MPPPDHGELDTLVIKISRQTADDLLQKLEEMECLVHRSINGYHWLLTCSSNDVNLLLVFLRLLYCLVFISFLLRVYLYINIINWNIRYVK